MATQSQYHNRINDLSDDARLIKCAFVEGMHDPAHLFRSHKVHTWLQGQSVGLGIEDELDVGIVIGNAKTRYAQTWHQNSLSSVTRYQPLQPDHVLAPYLSAVKGFKNRKLIRFRCGWHGLHVAYQAFASVFCALLVQQRINIILCLDCLAHCANRNKFTNTFWGPAPTLSSFLTLHDPKVMARFLKECFEHRNWLQHKLDIAFSFSLECVRCERYVFIDA